MTAPALGSLGVLPVPPPTLPAGVEQHWAEVEGAQMRYLRTGSGPPIVLVHGLLGYSFSWRFTMPALAPYATVFAPDMLGTGFSERPEGLDCSMRATASRLLQFVERVGLKSFDLLGTSHGGAVSILAAAECAAGKRNLRVRRLILVAPVNPYSAHGQSLAPFFGGAVGSWLFRNALARLKFLYRPMLERLYGDPGRIAAGTLEGYSAPAEIPGYFEHGLAICRTWREDLLQVRNALQSSGEMPVLLMWGSKDGAVYASSATPLLQHHPGAKLIVFPGVGHLPYEECPDEFNRALLGFLRETPAC